MVPDARAAVTRVAALLALALVAPAASAQPALLDSLRPRVEAALVRGDLAALDPIAERLRLAARTTGTRDPWTHYDLGYVLHRRASALLISDSVPRAKPLLEESERALARAAELGAGGPAIGLRGAVTGQLAGASGMFAAMRIGPRAWTLLDSALALVPDDPRVHLVNGMSRLNAPRPFGGGAARGEAALRRAVELFQKDTAHAPRPTWGRVDAHIWLAIALSRLDRKSEARSELQRALQLAPGHAWVTRELLPKLDASGRP